MKVQLKHSKDYPIVSLSQLAQQHFPVPYPTYLIYQTNNTEEDMDVDLSIDIQPLQWLLANMRTPKQSEHQTCSEDPGQQASRVAHQQLSQIEAESHHFLASLA